MKNTCCVPFCESRRSSVKLHRVPKTEIGLKWVTSIKCPKLKELSPEDLHKFFVCHKHFEKRFVTERHRLHMTAYPTLFTNVEMDTGIPALTHEDSENQSVPHVYDYPQLRKRRHEDHTYCKTQHLRELQQAQDYDAPSTSKLFKAVDQKQQIELHDTAEKLTRKGDGKSISGTDTAESNQQLNPDYDAPSTSKLFKAVDQKQQVELHDTADELTRKGDGKSISGTDTAESNQQLNPDYDAPSTSKLFKAVDQKQQVELHDTADKLTRKGDGKSISGTETAKSNQLLNPETLISIANVATPKKTRFVIREAKLTPRCKIIMKEYRKAKKQLNFATRCKNFMKLSKKENFDKMTRKMNPLARKILWLQITQCTKQTTGRRFSDEEKIIALAIMKQSPKSYKFLRRIFILPSIRTLNRMIFELQVEPGVNPQIFNAIKTEVENWEESRKYCSLVFDEVALESGLSYNKHKDNICGLVELDQKINDYADHALVFMLRGALEKWQQPVCFYFCEGATCAQTLKNILKKVILEVMKTGLIPLALVSDQGTAFQSAMNKLKDDTRRQQILAEENIDDTIEIGGQKINVIYDPPHLIKGLRNNFLTKDIKQNGKISKWSDIVDVYLTDCRHTEMRLLHKLNDEHVIPQKIKKMKVKNCTQVLSKTVAGALAYTAQFSHYTDGKEVSKTLKNTAETVSFLDELFDSCNGVTTSVKNKGKPLRQAVTNRSPHVSFWKNAIKKLREMRFISKDGKEVMVPSQKNFITTLQSMERLWEFFKEKGFKTMRPRYFNSDPVENFFGQIRAYSFRNNDPDCKTFKNIFRSLLITRFINFHSQSFNCEQVSGEPIIRLKHLFTTAKDVTDEMPSCETLVVSPEETQNIQAEARKERLNVHSNAYTAGWVVRKCLSKMNCVMCKKCLTQNNESSVHTWISHREFKEFKNNKKLTYPSEYAVRRFSEIVKETNEYLEATPNSNNIANKIANIIKAKYSFDFLKCNMHKQALLEYFVLITIKITVNNWCNMMNRILKGIDVMRLKKQLPLMQQKAWQKYQKKLKNKKLNK